MKLEQQKIMYLILVLTSIGNPLIVLGGFPIEIETQISELITYILAILI